MSSVKGIYVYVYYDLIGLNSILVLSFVFMVAPLIFSLVKSNAVLLHALEVLEGGEGIVPARSLPWR